MHRATSVTQWPFADTSEVHMAQDLQPSVARVCSSGLRHGLGVGAVQQFFSTDVSGSVVGNDAGGLGGSLFAGSGEVWSHHDAGGCEDSGAGWNWFFGEDVEGG